MTEYERIAELESAVRTLENTNQELIQVAESEGRIIVAEIPNALKERVKALERATADLREEAASYHKTAVEVLRERDEALATVARFTTALADFKACGLVMSNVCWSLGHKDRDVGNRAVLASLANRWDELTKKHRALLGETSPTETPDKSYGAYGRPPACPKCGSSQCRCPPTETGGNDV